MTIFSILLLLPSIFAHVYNETLDPWNINKAQDATDPLFYNTTRSNITYTKSPPNWRQIPVYTVLADKWMDGDPSNNDFFGLVHEYDHRETQMRAGGDARGLMDPRGLDYIYALGYRAIYIAGTPFLNMPWQSDGYSAIDFSLLDPHYGTLQDWIDFIDALHARGMYIIVDFTVGTMGDMIGFKKYFNSSAPFNINEYDVGWKLPPYPPWGIDKYPDWNFTNTYNDSCVYPTFWEEDGSVVDPGKTGCYASSFDHYGDVEAFGVFPDWQRQLAKFASVQDRLREWDPYVRDRLQVFSCLFIQALDVDGIRIDKATQVTVDFLPQWAKATRECAKLYNKDNFFIPGEVTGGDTFGALYIGRGRTPRLRPPDPDTAMNITPSDAQFFLRDQGLNGLDSAAFHYSIYRSLCRFLGMDGNLQVAYDIDVDFVIAWNELAANDDFINPVSADFDPRHLYGTTNQDVFRWPSIVNGTQRQQLGQFIGTLVLPGMPLLWYGEEQGLYLYDSQASNYLYGRQPMVSTQAWQRHGCYMMGSGQYYNMPLGRALSGCEDDWNSLDHFDPTAIPFRGIRNMVWLRTQFPSLLDGFQVTNLGKWTHDITLPGSNGTVTELGLYSVTRGPAQAQLGKGQFKADGAISQPVWLLYTNENATQPYTYDCTSENWISSPYTGGTVVRNLLYPYEEYTLRDSMSSFYINGTAPFVGCLNSVTMLPFEYKALVPLSQWVQQPPTISQFIPGHDARILSSGDTISIEIQYDTLMDCDSMNNAVSLQFTGNGNPSLSLPGSCLSMDKQPDPDIVSVSPSLWRWQAQIQNAADGIYVININSVASQNNGPSTGTTDHLLLRRGQSDNPMVFPIDADYNDNLLSVSGDTFTLNHSAPGADKFRYSGNFGQTWSPWQDYETTSTLNATLFANNWWKGYHVQVQYYSKLAASSSYVVHGDANWSGGQRRYPQILARGAFNTWGYDLGARASFALTSSANWEMPLSAAWPSYIQLNVYSYDDFFYGDADGDGIIDRFPPNALTPNYLNMSMPPAPHLAWNILVNDQTGQWSVTPIGHENVTIIAFALLFAIPVITALGAAATFRYSFYTIKVNKWGLKPAKEAYFPIVGGHKEKKGELDEKGALVMADKPSKVPERIIGWPEDVNKRRKVLIATLEYEILDWKLKVKIGGLGVMSTLMGKAMTDVDLLWVVPKVQDIDYPQGDYAEPIEVVIFGEPYLIEVETHQLDNITYIILDSPVFRAQTKSDPYPQRMDDLSSAIFYSTWNQAIAEAIRRNPIVDIYHINDYHGALAPLYLLPKVMPVCLSLHNAEFQGLWPLRTKDEMKEVCAAFNIPKEICSKYVQFGNTFNLLHAAASYISHHQKSVGVAGVSDKYGKRSWARYPALWTLRNIDSLPNPDPTDIAALDEQPLAVDKIVVDQDAESKRPEFKRQAQEWAGIKQDPNADLFVFVGRWSKQKGVDLIADVMPGLLEKKSQIQLICVGPVIDLYGRFAAEKLARLMEMYPDRVYSKPEFTALPPYLFSGADFALIPSRDEPFGLVAVEFGRKGALGVGSRLGGLGLMPGWWFPVESSATVHMLSQLTKTIKLALKSTQEERAILRARSAVQRFPVVEWRQRLEDFQRRSIATSRAHAGENAWGYDQVGSMNAGLYAHAEAGSTTSLQQWNRPGTPDSSAPPSPMPQERQLPGGNSPLADKNFFDPNAPMSGNNDNNSLSAGAAYHNRFAQQKAQNRQSAESFYDEEPDPNAGPLYYKDKDKRKSGKKFFAGYDDEDVPSSQGSSDQGEGDTTVVGSGPTGEGNGAIPKQPQSYDNFLAAANRQFSKQNGGKNAPDPFMDSRRMSSMSSDSNFAPPRPFSVSSRANSFDSISSIVDEKGNSPLNKAMEAFTDSDGEVAQTFVQKLQHLTAGNSKKELCIDEFLQKSEKRYFNDARKDMIAAQSVRSSRDSFMQSRPASMMDGFRPESARDSYTAPYSHSGHDHEMMGPGDSDHYGGDMYDHEGPPETHFTKLQIFMSRKIGGWPLYTIIISLGQLLSATSFQLSLLSGSNTLKQVDLYIICSIFFVSTLAWYTLFRMKPSVWVLSLPWLLFSAAFLLIGFPSLHGVFTGPRTTITRVATWLYAIASSAGFLFFGLNFGDEAGAATEVWVTRACIVQGLQQIWVSALWYWGYTLNGIDPALYVTPRAIMYVVWPLAVISLGFAYLMFRGVPEYYQQIPPYVPNFFHTLFRRKLVIWFLISEILRDYWLSGPYGRNWQFLWAAADVPKWAVVVMIAIFFIGVWGMIMGLLIRYSKVHSWLLPIFAIGLGCPRWCQMWWGTSGMGLYIPWGGAAGPYIGTCLWLWLGVLDAIQGVGLGMILLQTLSRLHVCATLAGAQILGSAVVMIARATAPDKVGPGNVFPNAAIWDLSTGKNNPFVHWEFWLCLVCQLVIVVGYAVFFRREQLSKP
ncbi:alpha-1,3-glucan synthase [Tremella mesenterica]|uniref:alpha-1,3-glucan synthase n=1 Tax=Tremella mesenterica TaxID=5217 RepID=A0A4Q1BRH5_TREME|nr:alpha-1,3-glucan synthase [Tremella mesenterica]